MRVHQKSLAERVKGSTSSRFAYCQKCKFTTFARLLERNHAHHAAEPDARAAVPVGSREVCQTAGTTDSRGYWSGTPAVIERRRLGGFAPKLHPARAALLGQFRPSWADEPVEQMQRRKIQIFRAWKLDESGRKIWARDYGHRAWPMWVDAEYAE